MKAPYLLSSIFAVLAVAETCLHDSVFRCLLGTAVASPFCSSYLSLSIVTVTIATITPVV